LIAKSTTRIGSDIRLGHDIDVESSLLRTSTIEIAGQELWPPRQVRVSNISNA